MNIDLISHWIMANFFHSGALFTYGLLFVFNFFHLLIGNLKAFFHEKIFSVIIQATRKASQVALVNYPVITVRKKRVKRLCPSKSIEKWQIHKNLDDIYYPSFSGKKSLGVLKSKSKRIKDVEEASKLNPALTTLKVSNYRLKTRKNYFAHTVVRPGWTRIWKGYNNYKEIRDRIGRKPLDKSHLAKTSAVPNEFVKNFDEIIAKNVLECSFLDFEKMQKYFSYTELAKKSYISLEYSIGNH